MEKKQVLVIGASGMVGQATVKRLSSEFGDQVDVKAGVRNPQKASALNDLKAVTVVQAEMGDTSALKKTFQGVDSLFIVTPGADNRVHLVIETAKAAKEAGVKFLLVVSGASITHPEMIKVFGTEFSEIESAVPKLGVPFAFLGLPAFMETFFGITPTIEKESRIYSPVMSDKPIVVVAADDIGLAAATILASPEKHAGKKYTIVSDRVSYGDLVTAMSKVLGRKIEYVQISYEDSEKGALQLGVPERQVKIMHSFFNLVDISHPLLDVANVDEFFEITGKKPTDLTTWLTKMGSALK